MRNQNPATAIPWRDLLTLTRFEKAWELSLSLPWLLGALYAYHFGYLLPGAICSFYFFLTGLRQSHGAQHYSLGVPKLVQDVVLFLLSITMLASMHAVQASHLHHHRHCLEDEDTEGSTARLKWWQALLIGPIFVVRLHTTAWRLSGRKKRCWILAELLGVIIVVALALTLPEWRALRWHVAAMLAGECMTGFFAVWTVHHGCDSHHTLARTQRGRWVNWFTYSMFYHAEHHLFPQVPTCRLGVLAQRIDEAHPSFADEQVIPLGSTPHRLAD